MYMKKLIASGAAGLILIGAISPTTALPLASNSSAVKGSAPAITTNVHGHIGHGGHMGYGGHMGHVGRVGNVGHVGKIGHLGYAHVGKIGNVGYGHVWRGGHRYAWYGHRHGWYGGYGGYGWGGYGWNGYGWEDWGIPLGAFALGYAAAQYYPCYRTYWAYNEHGVLKRYCYY